MNVFLFIGLECDEGSMNRLVLREEKELNLNNVDCTRAERGRGCVLECIKISHSGHHYLIFV